MFAPAVIADRRSRLERVLGTALDETAVGTAHQWAEALGRIVDERGQLTRQLTHEEQAFIDTERLLCKIDFPYWAERYAWISHAAAAVGPMYPLFESQRLILQEIGRVEAERYFSHHPDGVLVNELKARQLGASTLTAAIITHRVTTHGNVFALIASDTPDSSSGLFRMSRRIVDHLPWYLKPAITDDVKNKELVFATRSRLDMAAGKSTRGTEGERGQIGRSFTYSALHLSELSTWDDAAQIDDSLMPAVPMSPRVFMVKESTAKGRHNWWHQEWLLSKRGIGRFTPIFIPWYAEPQKYWRPAPEGWSPDLATRAMTERAETYGPRWLHRDVTLTREQLYWWESTRRTFEEKDDLSRFLEEFPTDDEEAFQFSGTSVFNVAMREKHRQLARPVAGVVEIAPHRDLVMQRRVPFPSLQEEETL